MEFLLLGPLVVRNGYQDLQIARGNQRTVLAALLARANQSVSVPWIADVIWSGSPPRRATVTVQNYIKRLRDTLSPGRGSVPIRTHPSAYSITVGPDELDTIRFRQLGQAGLAAHRACDWDSASKHLTAALNLWRGPAFTDIPAVAFTDREASLLREFHDTLLEARIDSDLHLGRHFEALVDLRELISDEPLRERPYALLMLALYRCGRQTEALGTYQRAWRTLTAEAGVEPGPGLRSLQQRILRSDPALEALDTGC